MSNAKHTPGPWTVKTEDSNNNYQCQVFTKDGSYRIARIDAVTEDFPKVNAALIAAAPDLLEALASIRYMSGFEELLNTRYSKPIVHDILEQVDDAIKKAIGQV